MVAFWAALGCHFIRVSEARNATYLAGASYCRLHGGDMGQCDEHNTI